MLTLPDELHRAHRSLNDLADTLGDGGFHEFEKMSAEISAHTGRLTRAENAGAIIDDLIKVALREVSDPWRGFLS